MHIEQTEVQRHPATLVDHTIELQRKQGNYQDQNQKITTHMHEREVENKLTKQDNDCAFLNQGL